jgi:hypothetical protein
MVAFAGNEPVGVLIGAKRPSGTLVRRIAVHPDHRRHGHGRHLLASLGSKLSILGPPRMVAEVPERLDAACGLFSTSGYVREGLLTDYVGHPSVPEASGGVPGGRFTIPVTVDDLAANGLLGEGDAPTCWERSVETLTARKDEIAGLAIASDERIEAAILYEKAWAGPDVEIVSLGSYVEDGGARLAHLLARLGAQGATRFRMSKVHPAEVSRERLDALGFRPAGGHLLFAATAGTT